MVLRTELLLYHIFFYYIRHAKIVKFIIIQKSLDLCCYNCCDMKRINLDQEQSCLWRHKIIISKKQNFKRFYVFSFWILLYNVLSILHEAFLPLILTFFHVFYTISLLSFVYCTSTSFTKLNTNKCLSCSSNPY